MAISTKTQTKIKICGIRRDEDCDYINAAKPDYAGFIFWPKSFRYIDAETAKRLRARIHRDIPTVGVFVDAAPESIAELAAAGSIQIAQLHGHEDEVYINLLRTMLPAGMPIWKAFKVRSEADIQNAIASNADLVLLDNGYGSGEYFDHSLIRDLGRPYALAGGLTPENIPELKRKYAPDILDISSGVETDKVKDFEKIRKAVKAAREENMSKGRFGIHGGQYIPETLMNAVIELEEAYNKYKNDPEFNQELETLFNEYAGRPSRLYYAEKMTKDLGGAKIYLKREDLNHTGAHKINNVLGQALLAKKMGKTRLIAETGAGQHGVATATAAALLGMECVVFMGEEDTKRQALNVYKMRLLGSEVIPVTTGTATLKDAVSEAMREWTNRISDTHYCLGSVMGPHPFPTIVRDF